MMKLKGFEKLKKKFDRLSRSGAVRANRAGVRAGTAVLLKAVKVTVPVDEGILKRQQASKVTGKGMRVSGIVGADADKLEADETRPSNIDWLVEFGHVTPGGVFIPPSGYMRRAADTAMPSAEAAYIQRASKAIEREASR